MKGKFIAILFIIATVCVIERHYDDVSFCTRQ